MQQAQQLHDQQEMIAAQCRVASTAGLVRIVTLLISCGQGDNAPLLARQQELKEKMSELTALNNQIAQQLSKTNAQRKVLEEMRTRLAHDIRTTRKRVEDEEQKIVNAEQAKLTVQRDAEEKARCSQVDS